MADFKINPLVAQYLSGLGADLMEYGANTDKGIQLKNVNAITNQSIKANNMMKLMEQALSQDGSSVKVDSKGIKLDITPGSGMYKNLMGEEGMAAPAATVENAQGAQAAQPQPVQPQPQQPIANPLSEAAKNGGLAGLSTEDILAAINVNQRQQQIMQGTRQQASNELYRNNVTAPYTRALTEQAKAATAENIPSVGIAYGDKVMTVTPKDAIAWEKMKKETTPNEIKLYDYARSQGFQGSIVDFKNTGITNNMKDYEAAKNDPAFNQWLLKQKKAGATNISLDTKLEEKKAMSELEGQLYFNNPKWTDDIQKQVADFDKNQAWLIPEGERPLAKSKIIVKSIEDKITAGSGDIQKVAMDKDGKTMIWTVKWPSGDIKIIKQAVK